jgi:hypothetical protein
MPQSPQVADTAPDEPFPTGYDMAHLVTYARRGKGSEAGQAVMGEPSRAGQMDDRERLSLSPARRAAELNTAIGHGLGERSV